MVAFSNATKPLFEVIESSSDGTSFQYWENARKVLNPNILNICTEKGGEIRTITVQAGTFETCWNRRILKKRNKQIAIVETWLAPIPFNIVQRKVHNLRSNVTKTKTLIGLQQ